MPKEGGSDLRTLAVAAAAAFLFSTSAFAADEAAAPSANDRNEVVCKSLAPNTGTRLGARKTCLTRAEWEQRMQRDQEHVRQSQDTGLMGAPQGN